MLEKLKLIFSFTTSAKSDINNSHDNVDVPHVKTMASTTFENTTSNLFLPKPFHIYITMSHRWFPCQNDSLKFSPTHLTVKIEDAYSLNCDWYYQQHAEAITNKSLYFLGHPVSFTHTIVRAAANHVSCIGSDLTILNSNNHLPFWAQPHALHATSY